MKKKYKREAFYLDNGVLLHGYKDKRGFHPDKGLSCGFGLQILNKKAIGKNLFYKVSDAIQRLGNVEVAGGKVIAAIDDGMAVTRICCNYSSVRCWYETETLATNDNIETLILECLNSGNIKLCSAEVVYMFTSDKLKHTICI